MLILHLVLIFPPSHNHIPLFSVIPFPLNLNLIPSLHLTLILIPNSNSQFLLLLHHHPTFISYLIICYIFYLLMYGCWVLTDDVGFIHMPGLSCGGAVGSIHRVCRPARQNVLHT
jgi:hypothetical protein